MEDNFVKFPVHGMTAELKKSMMNKWEKRYTPSDNAGRIQEVMQIVGKIDKRNTGHW